MKNYNPRTHYKNKSPEEIDPFQEQKHRTNQLIHHLQMYLTKKHIKMKPVMKSMYNSLRKKKQITSRQLNVILPYLQLDMKNHTKEQIIDCFSCVVRNIDTVSDYDYIEKYYPHLLDNPRTHPTPSTLEEFMN